MFKYTVIHHSVTSPGTGHRLTDYHLVLDLVDGKVKLYEHKLPYEITRHAVGLANSQCYSVCVVGNFQVNKVPDLLFDALVQALAIKCQKSEISRDIRGHYHIGRIVRSDKYPFGYNTACPGQHMIARLPELRIRVARYL